MAPSPPDTRASLILRLRDAADTAAWDEVVAIYGPLVFRMAQRQGLQPADADDVVQEVFAAVAASVADWVDRSSRGRFRAWLLTIARNIAINALTRRPQGGVGAGGDGALASLVALPAPSDSNLSSQFDVKYQREVFRWAAERVRDAVAPSTWDAFHRTHVQGHPIADVARQLGISVGGVYIARSRVMHRMRALAREFQVTE